jgi:hypothetical protein
VFLRLRHGGASLATVPEICFPAKRREKGEEGKRNWERMKESVLLWSFYTPGSCACASMVTPCISAFSALWSTSNALDLSIGKSCWLFLLSGLFKYYWSCRYNRRAHVAQWFEGKCLRESVRVQALVATFPSVFFLFFLCCFIWTLGFRPRTAN